MWYSKYQAKQIISNKTSATKTMQTNTDIGKQTCGSLAATKTKTQLMNISYTMGAGIINKPNEQYTQMCDIEF